MLRVLDLFSGIGGFSLGLERTGGFQTVAFCEIDRTCRSILAKHWPDVKVYADVKEVGAARLTADGITCDVVCGGFPCQDLSYAGRGAGLAGARSGLWSEYARIICELRPMYVIVENVTALLARGLGTVLGDLAKIGYDAWWDCLPASTFGAPHQRDRVYLVAYPNGIRWSLPFLSGLGKQFTSWAPDFGSARMEYWDGEEICPPLTVRVVDGVPSKVDDLAVSKLGNAVVPLIIQQIGEVVLNHFNINV